MNLTVKQEPNVPLEVVFIGYGSATNLQSKLKNTGLKVILLNEAS